MVLSFTKNSNVVEKSWRVKIPIRTIGAHVDLNGLPFCAFVGEILSHADCISLECGAEGTPEELTAAAAEAAALAEQEAWANAPTVSRRPNLETVTTSASAEASSLPTRTVDTAPPPPPRTGYELESGLKSLARLGDAATADWLLAIPPAKLTAMLRSVLTAELILAILRPLGSVVEANPNEQIGPVVGLLVALTKAERFDMTVRTFVDLG